MRHIYRYALIVMVALSIAGCNKDAAFDSDPKPNTIIKFILDDIVCVGELREGLNSQDVSQFDKDKAPFVEIPFSGHTGARISITDISMPSGLSIGGTYQLPANGQGKIHIPVQGTPMEYGDKSMKFTITHNDESYDTDVNVYILGKDEDIENLVLESAVINGVVKRGTVIQKDEDGRRNIEIEYNNGWGRQVTLAITSPKHITIPAQDATVKLSGGSYKKKIILPISGYYDGDMENIDIVVEAQTSDMDIEPTATAQDVPTVEVAPLVVTYEIDAELKESFPVGGNKQIKVHYEGGELRDVVLSLTEKSPIAGLSSSLLPSSITLEKGAGDIYILLSGTPTESGDYILGLDVQGAVLGQSGLQKQIIVNVEEYVEPIEVSAISIDGPFVVGSTSSTFKVTVDYNNSSVNGGQKSLAITDITGYVVTDAEKLKGISKNVETGSGKSITIDLGVSPFISSTFDKSSIFPATKELNISMSYNGIPLVVAANISAVNVNASGFVWKSKVYNVVTVGSQKWLDRNMGALSNSVATAQVDADGAIASWAHDFSAYGAYFQRSFVDGVYIDYSGVAALKGYRALPNTTVVPGNTNSPAMEKLLDRHWSVAEDGGESNPCPTGYRVPSSDEVETMVKTITSISAIPVNDKTVIAKMVNSALKFPLAGNTTSAGVLLNSVGIEVKDEEGVAVVAGVDKGEISLFTTDYYAPQAATFLKYLKVTAAGDVRWSAQGNSESNRNTAVQVRCIKH